MANLDDLINHPNFARLLRDSPGFADSFLTRYLKQAEGLGDALTKMDITTELDPATGSPRMKISLLNDEREVVRNVGEPESAYFARAQAMANDDISRLRRYSGTGSRSTQTGSAMNRRLSLLSDVYGVDFNVASIPANEAAISTIEQQFGKNAFIKADTDTITVLTAIDRKNGKPKTLEQITRFIVRRYQVEKIRRDPKRNRYRVNLSSFETKGKGSCIYA
jgi:hypothetical protein